MQTTKPVSEFVFLGLALGTSGLTLIPFVLFRAAVFLPVGIGIHAGTFKLIYTASLAITLTAALGALICSAMRRDVWSALVSFAPVAMLIVFAYSLFGLALLDIR
jgi:hypothetical protein